MDGEMKIAKLMKIDTYFTRLTKARRLKMALLAMMMAVVSVSTSNIEAQEPSSYDWQLVNTGIDAHLRGIWGPGDGTALMVGDKIMAPLPIMMVKRSR